MSNEKYIVVDLNSLMPGDIILTTQCSITSLFIRLLTFSKFSHVAIYVGEGLIFETTPKTGAAYASMKIVKVTNQHKYATVENATHLLVCRHKNSSQHFIRLNNNNLQQWKITQANFISVINDKWGDEYAKLEELAKTIRFISSPFIFLAKKIGKISVDKNKIVAGDFCSNLISNIYGKLGLNAFNSKLNKNPSPQTFLNKKYSNFKIVSDIYSNESEVDDQLKTSYMNIIKINDITISSNNIVLQQKKCMAILDVINNK